jgi:hypothetical protein
MDGGKGIYVSGTLISILISLALWPCTSQAGASRRSSSDSGPPRYSTWARACWTKTRALSLRFVAVLRKVDAAKSP